MRLVKSVITGGLATLVLWLGWNFYQFSKQYRFYNNIAKRDWTQVQFPSKGKEAIVVLTGDQSRIPKGFEILNSRPKSILIISGTAKETSLKDLINQQASHFTFVPEVWDRVILDPESSSTKENAIETRKLVEKLKIEQALLITSDYHMPRALYFFKQEMPNLIVVPVPVDSQSTAQNTLTRLWKIGVEFWKNLSLFRLKF